MPMSEPPPDLEGLSLAEIARLAAELKLPPVASWNPERCGHSEMRIARDGTWFHQGDPIRRPAMIRLFSNILRREPDGSYVLVTPVEKLDIEVEDTPFLAVELKTEGSGRDRQLAFRLNTGDVAVAGPNHRIRLNSEADPHPVLQARPGLDARIVRPVYYELTALALDEEADPPGLWSDGCFFRLDGAA